MTVPTAAGAPSPDAGDLVLSRNDGIATLWLNRPAKRNAVTYQMWLDIAAHCRSLAADPTVRMVVVQGVGAHFCAGADIAGMAAVDADEYRRANEIADEALAAVPVPTVAVVTGSCIGGGTEIAVACDLRLADTTARFGITPARLGILYPAPAIERVVRLIGASAAKHLLYSAEHISAERALRTGLVDELHPPDELAARVDEHTDLLARRRSLLTQMASKEMVDLAARDGAVPAEVVDRWARTAAASADAAEGIRAFVAKRPPAFTWAPDPAVATDAAQAPDSAGAPDAAPPPDSGAG